MKDNEEYGECIASNGQALRLPIRRFVVTNGEEVVRHDHGISTAEGKDDSLDRKGCGEEVLWPWVCLLEVGDFTPGARGEGRSIFEVDREG